MKNELKKTQKNIPELVSLPDNSFENIFQLYKDDDFYAYNILRSISLPADLDPETFYYKRVSGNTTWTNLSLDTYGTIKLWWLICIVNGIRNPVSLPEPGLVIKIIKPQYAEIIISKISQSV